MRSSGLIISALLAFGSNQTAAQSVAERAASVTASDFVVAFIGDCVQNAGRFDKVEAAARLLNYNELTGDALLALGPSAQNADMQGWLVSEGEAAPYLLGLSSGEANGQGFAVCAVANPYLPPNEVADALRDKLNLAMPRSDEYNLGQRYRIWNMQLAASGAFLTLMDAERMAGGGVTLSLAVPLQN